MHVGNANEEIAMSIFSKSRKPARDPMVKNAAPCEHWELAPRWSNATDMGKRELVTSFVCGGCGESFTPDQAASLKA